MALPVKKFEGLVAAPFTPLTAEGALNLQCIPKYVDFLLAQGVKGVFVCGTTGEGVNFNVKERKQIAEKWIRCAKGILDIVIIQIGGSNLTESQELARHAESIGADAIAALPPVFFKPKTLAELVSYMKCISESAPKTPLFYYHIPSMSGVSFNMESFLQAAENQVSTLSGLKFSESNLFDFSRCVQFGQEKFQLFLGADEILLGGLALGAKAAVGSTYNFSGNSVNRMLEAFKRGDIDAARKEQYRNQALVKLIIKYGGGTASMKAIMIQRGFDVGPPRAPQTALSDEQMQQLTNDLEDIGFLQWA